MRILDNLFGGDAARLQEALGKTTERQALLLGNLANVNTPGYKRKDMSFSVSLEEARQGTNFRLKKAFRGFQDEPGEDNRSLTADGNSVNLEEEVAALTETQLHFSAVSLASKRFFQGLKEVIREGR